MKNKINLESGTIEKADLKNCLSGVYGQPVVTMKIVTWLHTPGENGEVSGTIGTGSTILAPSNGTPVPGSFDSGSYF